MSTTNRVFDEIVEIKSVDKDVKVFDKVQRVEGVTRLSNYFITMDINSEIYPMKVGEVYSLVLARSLNKDGSEMPKQFTFETFTNTKNSEMDNFEYVMHGTVFEFSNDKKAEKKGEKAYDYIELSTLNISISFGGLLFQIGNLKKDEKTNKPVQFEDINLDDKLYLLLKKTK